MAWLPDFHAQALIVYSYTQFTIPTVIFWSCLWSVPLLKHRGNNIKPSFGVKLTVVIVVVVCQIIYKSFRVSKSAFMDFSHRTHSYFNDPSHSYVETAQKHDHDFLSGLSPRSVQSWTNYSLIFGWWAGEPPRKYHKQTHIIIKYQCFLLHLNLHKKKHAHLANDPFRSTLLSKKINKINKKARETDANHTSPTLHYIFPSRQTHHQPLPPGVVGSPSRLPDPKLL